MSNPLRITYALAAAVANGIAQSQAVGAAGPLTLNGSLVSGGVATLDSAGASRRVLIASAGADSAIVFTITGTDRNGNVQSELLTGVASGSSQFSVNDYKTVTGISASAATAGNITAGTNGVGSTAWQLCNFMEAPWNMSVATVGASATTYTVEHTYDDITETSQNLPQGFAIAPNSNVPPVPWASSISAATGNNEIRYVNWPIFAVRLTINSGTGTVAMQTLQSGRGSGHA